MTPIVPTRGQLDILRGIAGAGFDYSTTKWLCSGAGWELVEDEPDLGFVQFFLLGSDRALITEASAQRRNTWSLTASAHLPSALLFP